MNWVEAGPGRLIAVTIAVLAAAGSIGAIAALTGHDDTAHPGDVAVTIRDFAFDPPTLETPAGEVVALIVHNADPALHDFTIDGTVSLDVPGSRTRRATFMVPAGSYTFWCTLHPSMSGRLHVTQHPPEALSASRPPAGGSRDGTELAKGGQAILRSRR